MRVIVVAVFLLLSANSFATTGDVQLFKANTDLNDKPSLQRGAKYYMNYCAGCHSLKFIRFNRMAKDIGIVKDNGEVDDKSVTENLIFTGEKIGKTLEVAMPASESAKWFGVAPPDLSLIARVRGVDWLYTYLLSFYQDDERLWGTNNRVFPDVAMPNVLLPLQGVQRPVYQVQTIRIGDKSRDIKVIDYLTLSQFGEMNSLQFKAVIADIVNFLDYVSEPSRQDRERIGVWVLAFLALLFLLAYLLKREYWRDIH